MAEYHFDRIEPADFRWEPAPVSWNVRRDADGEWEPDWAQVEPDPVPVPTIAWATWHIGWWWSVTIAHLRHRIPPERTDVRWPGDGAPTVEWLTGLRDEWVAALDQLTEAELDATAPFPWPADSGRTVAEMIAWAHVELMKNVAELGQLSLLRRASTA